MNGIEVLKMSMGMSTKMMLGLAEDLMNQSMVRACNGGNHALWIVGHMAHSDDHLFQVMYGGKNQMDQWDGLFKAGTLPSDDPTVYPDYEKIIEQFKQQRGRLVDKLDTLTDPDLNLAAAAPPEGMEEFFGSIGSCMLIASIHAWHHRGQLADIRKVLGRAPMVG